MYVNSSKYIIIGPDELYHVISTHFFHILYRVTSLQSLRYARLVLVTIELHFNHIHLHFLLLVFDTFLELVEICQFHALMLLYLFTLQEPAANAFVHDPGPKSAG